MIAWQNQTAGRLHNGLLWALGALCGIALTAILARIFAPEAWLLWGAILCALCAAMAARLLWGGQPPKHQPSPRPARPPQARAISPPRRTSSPPSIIGRLDHIFNHRSASAMGGSPAWRLWNAGTIQARAWFHRWHFYPPSLRLNSGIN